MADRKLVVSVIGDDRSFQETLTRSTAAAKTFARNVNQAMGRGSTVSVGAQFEPLLQRNRQLQAQADDLTQRLQKMDVGFAGASQSSTLLGGSLLGLVGRVSAVGFAVNAAYTASRHLQQGLETTGHEATTTAGKLRNLGAALLSGDVVGAFQALRREPQNLEELGISAVQASNRMGALSIVAHTNADALRDQANESEAGQAKLRAFKQAADEAGTSNTKLAQELLNQVAAMQAADNAANALADSVARLGTVFRDSTGQAVLFKGAVDDAAGPRGPGAVDQINANLAQARAGTQFRQAAQPDNRVNANKQILARANGDLAEVLQLQEKERDRLRDAVQSKIGNEKERKALQDAYVRAQADVIATEKAIKAQTDATNKAAKTAAAQARSDTWAKIINALDIGVTRAQLTKDLGDDLDKLKDLRAGLERQIKAGVDVGAAQARLAQTEVAIAAKQDEIARARAAAQDEARKRAVAAEQARQFRAIGLGATGQEIVPGVENLRKRIDSALRRFDSGDLKIGSKLVSRLKLARAEITREGGKLTSDTRSVIDGWLDSIQNSLDKADRVVDRRSVQLSDKILAALGFSVNPDVARLSSVRAIGNTSTGAFANAAVPHGASVSAFNFNAPVTVVANNPPELLRELQKHAGRTSGTARGRFPGRSLGLG